MMQATLLNFGGNTRVVNDNENKPVPIGIGAIVECNIHDVHFHMIRRAVANETLMVIPHDARLTPKLSGIMELLRGIETEPYEELLQRFFEVLPPPGLEEGAYRPDRSMIRHALLEASRVEVAKTLRLQSRVVIREQGDEITRTEVPPLGQPKTIEVPPQDPPKVIDPAADKPKGRTRKASKAKPAKARRPVVKARKRERL
jgi:hypothetical protein